MADVNLGFRILHESGDLPPRAMEYTMLLLEIANRVMGSKETIERQIKGMAHGTVKLQVPNPKKGETGRQSAATFGGNIIDKQFKRAIAEEQKAGRLKGLTIVDTACGDGPTANKKGPDCYLDQERVAWDITSEASVSMHFDRDVRGREETWNAYIVFPY